MLNGFQELRPGDYFANSHNILPWLFSDFVGRKNFGHSWVLKG